jgi:putative flavoprotein involved in K+ transport
MPGETNNNLSVPPHAEAAMIGAGAAGLGAAAELQRRGIGTVVLEREGSAGTSWHRRYEGLRLNTVRWMSGLPGARIHRSAGRWPARADFADYLAGFPARRGLDVRFGVRVSRIDRTSAGWRLETSAGRVDAATVVVATGYDRVPKAPAWPGSEDFTGHLIHASEYHRAADFAGQDVLVVGVGNSGTEIATQLAHGGADRVRIAMRTPVNLVPHQFLGLPITILARASEAQPDWLVDRMTALLQRLAWGDLTRFGMPPAPHGVATELRVKGLGPVLDRGFVAALKAGSIELVPALEGFAGPDVVLAGGERVRPDTVIAATGYRHGLEELVGHLGVLLPSGKPAVLGARTHPDAPGLYFNGFWLPASGQLPAMRRTSRQIARAVARERRAARRARRTSRRARLLPRAPGRRHAFVSARPSRPR